MVKQEDVFAPGAPYYTARTAYGKSFFEKLSIALKIAPTHRILDLACGGGELAFGFSPYVARVLGLDVSPAMLDNAKEIRSENVALKEWDLNQHCYVADEKYDFVTIGRAICYLDPKLLEMTLSRSLRGGGLVLVCGAGPAEETTWLKEYRRIVRQFVLHEWHDFSGVQEMRALSYTFVGRISTSVSVHYDFDRIMNFSLSYHTRTNDILSRADDFKSALSRALAHYESAFGNYPTLELSWANIFRKNAELPTKKN